MKPPTRKIVKGQGNKLYNAWMGRVFWATMAVLPILAWLAAIVFINLGRSLPGTTGDPLVDRLLNALAERPDVSWHELSLPDETFAAWEDDLGDDPDYWVLRAISASNNLDLNSQRYPVKGFVAGQDHIEEARRRSVADGVLLKALLLLKDSVWCNELEDLVTARYPGSHSSPEEYRLYWLGYWQPLRELISEHHGEEFAELLADLQAEAGDCSITWYLSAKYAAQSGDNELALEYIRRGNRVPRNSNLVRSTDTIVADADSGQWLADPVIHGRLQDSQYNSTYYSSGSLLAMVRYLCADAASRGDLEALDELHTMACRYTQARIAGGATTYNNVELVSAVRDAFQHYLAGGQTREQQQALNDLDNRIATARNASRTASRGAGWGQMHPLSAWLDSYFVFGGTHHHLNYMQYRSTCAILATRGNSGLLTAFEDLETFSYQTLCFE